MSAHPIMIGGRHDAALVLYQHGWSDVRIASGLGLHDKTIARWRKQQGLSRAASTLSTFPHERCLELYNQGLTDLAVGKGAGVTERAIWKWRHRRQLPANPNKPAPVSTAERREMRRLLRKGLTVQQVADDTGRACGTVRRERSAVTGDKRLHPVGTSAYNMRRGALACSDLVGRVRAALPRHYAEDITAEAEGEMLAELMAGRLAVADIKTKAPGYLSASVSKFASRYGASSLDEQLEEDGFTLGSMLVDEASTSWMDGALERA